MPSENKTPNIGLNQWEGNEYIKREDFVDDNALIDAAIQAAREEIHSVEERKADLQEGKVILNQLPIASQIEAETGVSDTKLMTPLKVRQFIVANGGSGSGVTNVVFQSGKKYWKYTATESTDVIEMPTEQFNPINDVLEIIDDNNLILLKDINYVISGNTITLTGWELANEESLHFLITQTAYDYNSLVNKPEIVNDYSGGVDKLASAETVKQLFQFANDGKGSIATEINTKGVTATIAETFSSLANKIKLYLTKIEGTAVAGDVLSGKTCKNSTGNLITGTISSKTAQTYTPSTVNQTIAANQFLSGIQTILGSPNFLAENIKNGVNMWGKVGSFIGFPKPVTLPTDFGLYGNTANMPYIHIGTQALITTTLSMIKIQVNATSQSTTFTVTSDAEFGYYHRPGNDSSANDIRGTGTSYTATLTSYQTVFIYNPNNNLITINGTSRTQVSAVNLP